MEPWVWALVLPVAAALVGIIYWAGQNRDDKQDARAERNEEALKEHIKEDTKIHERVVRLETTVESHEKELGKLRDMRHDILDSVTKTLAGWYSEIMEAVRRMIDQLKR